MNTEAQKNLGEQLKKELGEQYLQILDAIHELVLVKGPRSRIVWANRAFREYYGMSNEQLKGVIDAPFAEPDYTQQYVKDDATTNRRRNNSGSFVRPQRPLK